MTTQTQAMASDGRQSLTEKYGGLVAAILKRLGQTLIVLFAVATVTFFLVRLIGDPIRAMLPDNATPEQEEALRTQLGFDRPLLVQYLSYLGGLLRFDFGMSVHFHQPAIELILNRLPATVELAAGALVFALIVAIPAGIIAAVRRGKATDSAVVGTVLVGQSTPAFFVGILLILIFAVTLHVLPANGRGGFDNLIMPAVTLGLYSMAMIARLLRSSLIDVLGEDFVRYSRAKGLSKSQAIARHALRNSALPVITIVGLEIGNLLGGAILTEQVFAWPGIGRLTVEAITNRDFPLIQATVIFISFVFVITNMIVDLAYSVLDPRVRVA